MIYWFYLYVFCFGCFLVLMVGVLDFRWGFKVGVVGLYWGYFGLSLFDWFWCFFFFGYCCWVYFVFIGFG